MMNEDVFLHGLSPWLSQAATLLNVEPSNEMLMRALFEAALNVKQQIYGNRIVLFAPVYIANYCVNTCTYCAFRGSNTQMERSELSEEQLK